MFQVLTFVYIAVSYSINYNNFCITPFSQGPTDLTVGPQAANLKHYYRCGDDPGDSDGVSGVLIDQMPGGINLSSGMTNPIIDTDVP